MLMIIMKMDDKLKILMSQLTYLHINVGTDSMFRYLTALEQQDSDLS